MQCGGVGGAVGGWWNISAGTSGVHVFLRDGRCVHNSLVHWMDTTTTHAMYGAESQGRVDSDLDSDLDILDHPPHTWPCTKHIPSSKRRITPRNATGRDRAKRKLNLAIVRAESQAHVDSDIDSDLRNTRPPSTRPALCEAHSEFQARHHATQRHRA